MGYFDVAADKVTNTNCSSRYSVLYGADTLFDNNTNTFWENDESEAFPHWVQVQFPFARTPIRISITSRPSYGSRAPKEFIFYGSNTGNFSGEETALYTSGEETGWGSDETRSFTFANTTSFFYFRLKIISGNDATYLDISSLKIEIDDTTGEENTPTLPADLSGGQIYSQSSSWDNSCIGSKAFDDNTTTLWHTAGASSPPHWVQVQFGSATRITLMTWKPRVSDTNYNPKDFNIKGSNTGSFSGEETTIATFSLADEWYSRNTRYFLFSNANSYLYYRIVITSEMASGTLLMVSEIELMELDIVDYSVITLKYRTGATEELCAAADYIEYTGEFDSEGYVQLRVEG
jgi:hypothetical protein